MTDGDLTVLELYKTAKQLCNKGEYILALTHIERALVIDAGNAKYWYAKGSILEDLNRMEEAVECFERAHDLTPLWPKPLVALGMVYYDELNDYEKARIYFERSLAVRPDLYVYTLLSNIELNSNPEKALRYAEQALAIDATWSEAIELRADALVRIAEMTKND